MRPTTLDRWLAIGFALSAITEVAVRPELTQRPWSMVLTAAFAGALWLRRAYPFAATVGAFSLATTTTLVEIRLGLPEMAPYTSVAILLMPYSLFRWASRRQVAIGLVVIAAAYGASALHGEMNEPAEAVGAAVVLLFPGAVGASVRFRAAAQARDVEHAKLREREQLARELHDSVAHHMTAITIQAQAARTVVSTRPDVAHHSLKAIEDEARRALAELRDIVGALRDESSAALAPEGRIADIARFGRAEGASPTVAVELLGDLTGLAPSLERAVYRLAQESVTNALKHAPRATRIDVRVAAEGDAIRFTVQDDGEPAFVRTNAGFGLVGMAERAALLGGSFQAGPSAAGGWTVEALLPRHGGKA